MKWHTAGTGRFRERVREVRKLLAPWLQVTEAQEACCAAGTFGEGEFRLTMIPLGARRNGACWLRPRRAPDFPTDGERVLINVAVNQTVVTVGHKQAERSLADQHEWLRTTLASITDAVISTDHRGRVTFLNAVAEQLTGWKATDALGKSLPEVFWAIDGRTRRPLENAAFAAIQTRTIVGSLPDTILVSRDSTERRIDNCAAPITTSRATWSGRF